MNLQEKIQKANEILNQFNIQFRYVVTLGETEAKVSMVVKNNKEKLNIGLFKVFQNDKNESVFYCGKLDGFYGKDKNSWDNYLEEIHQLESYLNELNLLSLPYAVKNYKEELV